MWKFLQRAKITFLMNNFLGFLCRVEHFKDELFKNLFWSFVVVTTCLELKMVLAFLNLLLNTALAQQRRQRTKNQSQEFFLTNYSHSQLLSMIIWTLKNKWWWQLCNFFALYFCLIFVPAVRLKINRDIYFVIHDITASRCRCLQGYIVAHWESVPKAILFKRTKCFANNLLSEFCFDVSTYNVKSQWEHFSWFWLWWTH